MKKKKEPNSLWRKLCYWWYRQILREEKEVYAQGFHDGYWAGQKSKEKYPFL